VYWFGIILALQAMPMVSATRVSDQTPFPDIPFTLFSNFIEENFDPGLSLATVFTILTTLISNQDILNLHAHQQNPRLSVEKRESLSGWMKVLTRALKEKLGEKGYELFGGSGSRTTEDQVTHKLITLSEVLSLTPYNKHGQFLGRLKEVSQKEIEPALVICPPSMECQTMSCHNRGLLLHSRDRDISKVTLIKGTQIHDNVPVLIGECRTCKTLYHADHEHGVEKTPAGKYVPAGNVYLNSAKYLKVGQRLWVDRIFSGAVLNGVYSFHASTAAFVQYWNDSYWET
jgi:hypothetical protein